jgi:hypothetical protein
MELHSQIFKTHERKKTKLEEAEDSREYYSFVLIELLYKEEVLFL